MVQQNKLMSLIVRLFSAWVFLLVTVLGLPLGTILFPFVNINSHTAERSWVQGMWHFFRSGLITTLLIAIGAFLYFVIFRHSDPVSPNVSP